MTRNRSCDGIDSGFLLVEVLVALSMLLVALLAMMPMFTTAMKQNAYAKDMTVGSSLAMERVEQFARVAGGNLRRGTCCRLGEGATVTAGACGSDNVVVDGITYVRTCVIRQNIANSTFTNDSDAAAYAFPMAGIAHLQVSVTPLRSAHFAKRAVKPVVLSYWRVF